VGRWLTYLKERFPIVVYLLLCAGFTLSAASLGRSTSATEITIGIFGLLLFFAELRLMDEFKDYKKDLVAHPERPLPRGLLKISEVHTAIYAGLGLMLFFAAANYLFVGAMPGFLYLALTVYLYLMFKEFFIGNWLEPRMLLYAITHQLILLVLTSYAVSLFDTTLLLKIPNLLYGLVVLGGFFSYEVGRKLDPAANPILRTYRVVYGEVRTGFLLFVLMILSGTAAIFLHQTLGIGLIVVYVATFAVTLLCFQNRLSHKIAELFTSIGLLYAIWFGFLMKFVGA